MGFLDPKPVTPASLDSHPRLSATALSATYADAVFPEAFYQSSDNDDWALAIERALAYAVPLGRAVALKRIYPIKTPVDLIDGSTIVGVGRGTGVKAPTDAPVSMFNATGKTNILLTNFLADGGITPAMPKNFTRGMNFTTCANVRITDLHVKNCADWAISFVRSSLVTVFRHTHTGGGVGPINVAGGRDGLHFIDCSDVLVDNADIDSGDDCVAATTETVGNSRIVFKNITGRSDLGSVVVSNEEGGTTFPTTDLTISGISTKAPTRNVVRVQAINAGTTISRVKISDVVGVSSQNAAIEISAHSANPLIDLSISNCMVTGQTHGVTLAGVKGFTLTNVVAKSTATNYDGFAMFGCVDGTLSGCYTRGSALWGFQLNGSNRIALVNCTALDCGGPAYAGNNGGSLRMVNASDITLIGGSYTGAANTNYHALSQAGSTPRIRISPDTVMSGNGYNALQARLNASNGKVVTLPPGDYTATALDVGAGTVVLAEGVVITATGTGSTALVTLGAGASWIGGTLKGNRAGGSTAPGINATAGAGLRIKDVVVQDFGGRGLNLSAVTDYRLENVTVKNVAGQAFNLDASSRGNVSGCRVDGALHGIQWWGGNSAATATIGISDITITGCIIKNVTGGIWGSLGSRITVTGNTVENCTDVGIDFEGGEYSTASGNTVKNCLNGGLAVFYAAHDCSFTGNTVINDTTTGPAFKAFASPRGPNFRITVADNVLTTANTFPVVTDAVGMIDSTIASNTVRVTAGTAAGMRILDSNRNRITNNTVEVIGNVGLLLEGGSDGVVDGNFVRCVGTDASAIGAGGGINVAWRSSAYPAQRNRVKANTVTGFTTALNDNNGGSFVSANTWQFNAAETMCHYGTVGGTYYGYYSENRKPTAPKETTVVTLR